MNKPLPILDFSHNWNNKLDGTFFTTLRLSGRFTVGDWVQVFLKSSPKGRAQVIDKKQLTIDQLNAWICGLDTGYSVVDTVKILQGMYKNKISGNTTIFLYLLTYESKAARNSRELLESNQKELFQ